MPRLARKNIKVFAGSATNNGVFGSLQANNPTITSDVEQIQSLTAWGEGWNAATETSEELPPLEEIQGVEYVTTYQQAYIMQEGIPEWAATVTYYKGSLTKEVTSTGFRIYNSLTDNNIGNLLSDTSNWKKVMDSDDLYAFDSAVVHNTGNESVAGVKTFSSSPLVPTPSSGDNSQKAASTAFVTGVASGLQTQINTKANSSDVTNAINNLLSALYPVGSLYITTQYTGSSNSCPIASLISGSQWQLVAQDRALWGGNGPNANTTIAAGLPNITGEFSGRCLINNSTSTSGAFYQSSTYNTQLAGGSDGNHNRTFAFDASRSSSIYGASSTVQPPAYRVNIWRRIA